MSNDIDNLVKIISKLKTLGPKSARRIVLQLLDNKEELIKPLTKQLVEIYKNLRRCETCGDYFSVNSKCGCLNKKYKKIFVCEEIQDKWTVEESGICSGGGYGYHVIGGVLPAVESKKNSKLLISSLVNRVKNNSEIEEIILGLSNTIEGNVTSHFIMDSLQGLKVKITRLAQGISVGNSISYLDDGTLVTAFKNRSLMSGD